MWQRGRGGHSSRRQRRTARLPFPLLSEHRSGHSAAGGERALSTGPTKARRDTLQRPRSKARQISAGAIGRGEWCLGMRDGLELLGSATGLSRHGQLCQISRYISAPRGEHLKLWKCSPILCRGASQLCFISRHASAPCGARSSERSECEDKRCDKISNNIQVLCRSQKKVLNVRCVCLNFFF